MRSAPLLLLVLFALFFDVESPPPRESTSVSHHDVVLRLQEAFLQNPAELHSFDTHCALTSAGVLACWLTMELQKGDHVGVFVDQRLEHAATVSSSAADKVELPTCFFKSHRHDAVHELRFIVFLDDFSFASHGGIVKLNTMHHVRECVSGTPDTRGVSFISTAESPHSHSPSSGVLYELTNTLSDFEMLLYPDSRKQELQEKNATSPEVADEQANSKNEALEMLMIEHRTSPHLLADLSRFFIWREWLLAKDSWLLHLEFKNSNVFPMNDDQLGIMIDGQLKQLMTTFDSMDHGLEVLPSHVWSAVRPHCMFVLLCSGLEPYAYGIISRSNPVPSETPHCTKSRYLQPWSKVNLGSRDVRQARLSPELIIDGPDCGAIERARELREQGVLDHKAEAAALFAEEPLPPFKHGEIWLDAWVNSVPSSRCSRRVGGFGPATHWLVLIDYTHLNVSDSSLSVQVFLNGVLVEERPTSRKGWEEVELRDVKFQRHFLLVELRGAAGRTAQGGMHLWPKEMEPLGPITETRSRSLAMAKGDGDPLFIQGFNMQALGGTVLTALARATGRTLVPPQMAYAIRNWTWFEVDGNHVSHDVDDVKSKSVLGLKTAEFSDFFHPDALGDVVSLSEKQGFATDMVIGVGDDCVCKNRPNDSDTIGLARQLGSECRGTSREELGWNDGLVVDPHLILSNDTIVWCLPSAAVTLNMPQLIQELLRLDVGNVVLDKFPATIFLFQPINFLGSGLQTTKKMDIWWRSNEYLLIRSAMQWSTPLVHRAEQFIRKHFGSAEFIAIHWRRGDRKWQYETGYNGAIEMLATSPERVVEYVKAMLETYDLADLTGSHVFLAHNCGVQRDLNKVVTSLNAVTLPPSTDWRLSDEDSVVEQIIASKATHFVAHPPWWHVRGGSAPWQGEFTSTWSRWVVEARQLDGKNGSHWSFCCFPTPFAHFSTPVDGQVFLTQPSGNATVSIAVLHALLEPFEAHPGAVGHLMCWRGLDEDSESRRLWTSPKTFQKDGPYGGHAQYSLELTPGSYGCKMQLIAVDGPPIFTERIAFTVEQGHNHD